MPFKWFAMRLLTLCFCLACAMCPAWADATSDIETLLSNQQWLVAQQAIGVEMQKKKLPARRSHRNGGSC
jgi:hypothetical protein